MSKRAELVWQGLAALGIALLACWAMGIIMPTQWFSPDLNYRLQTDALLDGHLALQHHPFLHGYDWNWGHGAHQNWGLGVPLLRLPFEMLARLVGANGFPDRAVFWLLFSATSLVLFRAALRTLEDCGQPRVRVAWALLLTTLVVTHPSWVDMLVRRFAVYEEAIAFSFLWTLAILAALLNYRRSRSQGALFATCAAAGFIAFLRPTGTFAGIVTVGFALLIAFQNRVPARTLVLAAAVYGVFPFALLASNLARFGNPLEFGYGLTLAHDWRFAFILRVGNPFGVADLLAASRELWGSLFDVAHYNAHHAFAESIHAWQADAPRFREYYFPSLSPWWLLTTLAGWIAAAWPARSPSTIHGAQRLLAAWSAIVLALNAGFYLWSPAFTSRYAIDFLPALLAGNLCLVLALYRWIVTRYSSRLQLGLAAGGVAACIAVAGLSAASMRPMQASATLPIDADAVLALKQAWPDPPVTDVPEHYPCGLRQGTAAIPSNLAGWGKLSASEPPECRAHASVTVFMPPLRCVALSLESSTQAELDGITVRVGLTDLERTAEQRSDTRTRIEFCAPDGRVFAFRWNQVTMAMLKPSEFSQDPTSFQLLAVGSY